MSVLVNAQTRLICQGFTGLQGTRGLHLIPTGAALRFAVTP